MHSPAHRHTQAHTITNIHTHILIFKQTQTNKRNTHIYTFSTLLSTQTRTHTLSHTHTQIHSHTKKNHYAHSNLMYITFKFGCNGFNPHHCVSQTSGSNVRLINSTKKCLSLAEDLPILVPIHLCYMCRRYLQVCFLAKFVRKKIHFFSI